MAPIQFARFCNILVKVRPRLIIKYECIETIKTLIGLLDRYSVGMRTHNHLHRIGIWP